MTADNTSRPQTAYTPRFAGFVTLFGVLIAVGLVTLAPAALAAAGVLIVFLIAGVLQTPIEPGTQLQTAYEVTPNRPRPGDTVSVEVTVTNEGDHTFTDIRLVDTVPEALRVVGGAPRRGATLRPGEATTLSYDIVARRGEFTLGPITARTRTLIGSLWVQQDLPVGEVESIHCAVRAEEVPLEEQATNYIGDLLSTFGGAGIEFHSTREYQRGDPPSRINWRELAKHDDMSTITYREHRSANVTIVTDFRPPSRVCSGPGEPSGAMLATYATYQLLFTLINKGHHVGVALPGLLPEQSRDDSSFPCRRIDHGSNTEQKRRAFALFDEAESLDEPSTLDPNTFDSVTDVSIEAFVEALSGWTPSTTQFVYVTPLLDAQSVRFCEQLTRTDVPLRVVSPDPTVASSLQTTVPRRLVRVQRATRVESVRQQGATAIDWDPTEPLSVCCGKQTRPGE